MYDQFSFTLEVRLGPEKRHRQPEYRQPVQLGEDVSLEGQQRRQVVQLAIEPLPVPLAGVALGLARSLLGHRAEAGNKEDQDIRTHPNRFILVCIKISKASCT